VKPAETTATICGVMAGLALFAKGVRARRAIDFRDRVTLITGGSRGLGLLVARELGCEGARHPRNVIVGAVGVDAAQRTGGSRQQRTAVARNGLDLGRVTAVERTHGGQLCCAQWCLWRRSAR